MLPIANGNLQGYLIDANDSSSLPLQAQETKQKWFGCFASSLAYIYARGISHGNISLRSILLKGDETFFTEFAISKYFKTVAQLAQSHWFRHSQGCILKHRPFPHASLATKPMFSHWVASSWKC
jgi:hypothetical protein